eukprot:1642917-Pyramimonas_sp.AAC.1
MRLVSLFSFFSSLFRVFWLDRLAVCTGPLLPRLVLPAAATATAPTTALLLLLLLPLRLP